MEEARAKSPATPPPSQPNGLEQAPEPPPPRRNGLTRATEPPPPRWLGAAARAALLAAGAGVLVALATAAFWMFVIDQPAAAVSYLQIPKTPQLAADDAIGVAIPSGQAPRVESTDEGHLVGAATSAGPYAVLAAWTDAEVFVSRDDGRSFAQTLAGAGRIAGATFDDAGNLVAVRGGDRLGVQHADGSVQWRTLPASGPTLALATGAGWLGWLHLEEHETRGTLAILSLTNDLGVTWSDQVVPAHGNATNALRIESDGTIRIMVLSEDCHLQEARRFEGNLDARPFREIAWPGELASGWGLGNSGWAYTIGTRCESEANADEPHLCAIGPGPQPAVLAAKYLPDWDLQTATNPRVTLARSGTALLQLDGSRTSLLDGNAPRETSQLAVDGIGRAVATVGRTLVRWSARHGWRVLFAPDGYLLENQSYEVD